MATPSSVTVLGSMTHFQDAATMTLSFLARNTDASRCAVVVSGDGRTVSVRLAFVGSTEECTFDVPLFDVVTSATFVPSSPRVEVKLMKDSTYKWPSVSPKEGLERPLPAAGAAAGGAASSGAAGAGGSAAKGGSAAAAAPEKAAPAAAAPAAAAPPAAAAAPAAPAAAAPAKGAGPSAAPKKPEDWRSTMKEVEEEEAKEAKPEGEEALMDLFRSIYAKSNEDTRRASAWVGRGGE